MIDGAALNILMVFGMKELRRLILPPGLSDGAASTLTEMYLSVPPRFFDLFEKYGGYKTGKLKLKKPKQLQVSLLRRVVCVHACV